MNSFTWVSLGANTAQCGAELVFTKWQHEKKNGQPRALLGRAYNSAATVENHIAMSQRIKSTITL